MFSGRYETGACLGSGGMSIVHRATDLVLERTVAVKILAEHLSDDERFVARFRREAMAVAKLIHPNIVQVYDTGIDEGRHFIVMEFVEGSSGAQLLQRQGPFAAETVAEAGIQVCAGLDCAHRHGIIHRDVKPGNLMFVGGPTGGGGPMTVKLTDFGIAQAIGQTQIEKLGEVVGTRGYLCPEAWWGIRETGGFDIYGLGVVLHELAFGTLPVREKGGKIVSPPVAGTDAEVALLAVLERALADDPSDRFEDEDAFAEGLVGVISAS